MNCPGIFFRSTGGSSMKHYENHPEQKMVSVTTRLLNPALWFSKTWNDKSKTWEENSCFNIHIQRLRYRRRARWRDASISRMCCSSKSPHLSKEIKRNELSEVVGLAKRINIWLYPLQQATPKTTRQNTASAPAGLVQWTYDWSHRSPSKGKVSETRPSLQASQRVQVCQQVAEHPPKLKLGPCLP